VTGIVITAAALAEALGLLDTQITVQDDADIAVATAQNGIRLLQTVLEAKPEAVAEAEDPPPADEDIDEAPAPTRTEIAPAPLGRRRPSSVPCGRMKRTPAREALFRQLWPDRSVTTHTILERINALPGDPYSLNGMWSLARKLGMPARHAVPEPAPAPPAPAPAPAARLPDGPAIDGATEEDLREAEKMIRDNPAGWPGRKLADWFGWPIEQAGAFAQHVRTQMAGEKAAAE
jgi:hypothetical protein